MKRVAPILLFLPAFAQANWSAQGLPSFTPQQTGLLVSEGDLSKGTLGLRLQNGDECWQPAGPVRLNQTLSLTPCRGDAPVWRLFRDGHYRIQIDTRSGTPTLLLSVQPPSPTGSTKIARQCPVRAAGPLTIEVKNTFAEGSKVRDFYSGNTAVVRNGSVTFTPAPNSDGLLLLENASDTRLATFNWHNATVYFVMTDRYVNGNPANDNSYGRHKDGMQETGTFHGGDLQGLATKLDYLKALGVNVCG